MKTGIPQSELQGHSISTREGIVSCVKQMKLYPLRKQWEQVEIRQYEKSASGLQKRSPK